MMLLLGATSLALSLAATASSPERAQEARRRVCIVRHAESFKNLEHPPAHLSEAELGGLTEAGKAQARTTRERLALGKAARVFASPVQRAQATAAIIAAGRPVKSWTALQYLEDDGSAEQALKALRAEIERALSSTPAPNPLVLITHSDISALLLGEPAGTPIAERAKVHALNTGAFECVAWPKQKAGASP